MTKIWLATATSFRPQNVTNSTHPLPTSDSLQRRMERFGTRRDATRTGSVNAAPQPLDAQLIADGDALEATWQQELRAMIAARRGGAEEKAAARAIRAASEEIVVRIESARALTLDGLKVKARAESWRRDGEPMGLTSDEEESNDGWTEAIDMPLYEAAPGRAPIRAQA
jgi:hypothetical protein